VLFDEGRKNVSCPRAQDTLATPLSLQSAYNVVMEVLNKTTQYRYEININRFMALYIFVAVGD